MTVERVAARRSAPDETALRRLVEQLRQVPDRYRVLDQTVSDAARRHGITTDLLAVLADLGLPASPSDDGPRFDEFDLSNVSLALRLPSPRFLAMRGWAAAIRSAASTLPPTYVVNVEAACPPLSHEGPCVLNIAPALRDLHEYAAAHGKSSFTRRTPRRSARLHPEVAELTGLLKRIRFVLLPDDLSTDVGFLRETGLGDCSLTAKYMVEEASARGIRARTAFGLFVAAPYSIPHTWFDVHLNGDWVSFDPYLLGLLTTAGLLPADDWPLHCSVGGAVWRLGESHFQIAEHVGRQGDVSFPTQTRPS